MIKIKNYKLKCSILKNATSNNVSKNIKNYQKIIKKTCLSNNQINFSTTKKLTRIYRKTYFSL